jgi:hypothetical protein
MAAEAPSGYQAVLDNFDKYQFLYPFGWQVCVQIVFMPYDFWSILLFCIVTFIPL